MRQLLIVDDEKHAVRGIKAGVPWEQLGFAEVHEAYNVRMAIQIFADHKIDVLICDIEMPQGDGFELLAWVKEHSPRTETMFLTCHADFQYAQKAIQLGSYDYMLKPVRFASLESAVQKALEKLDKADQEREKLQFLETYAYYYRLWESYQPMFIERFWQDLINRTVPANKEKIREALMLQNIPYAETIRFQPVLISMQRWHKELTLREEKIMEYALRNAFEELALVKQRNGQLIQMKSGALLAIMQVEECSSSRSLTEQLRTYISACNSYFFCDLCCYVGEAVPIESIPSVYESLVDLELHNVTRTNAVITMGDKADKLEVTPLPVMNGWAEMLKYGRKKEAQEEIAAYLESVRCLGCADARWLSGFYEDVLQMMYHVLHFKGMRAHQVFSELTLSKRAALVTRSVTDLGQWVNMLINEVIGHIQTFDEGQSVVSKVRSYIAQHINEDLSRDDIASHVNLNADYLARIFKKELGLTISEYVLQERIAMAKEMLTKSELPITQIAYELGYGNYSHFSKMFKKATSTNPQEYRKLKQI